MQINGHELKFSMTNVKTADKFEKALVHMKEATDAVQNEPVPGGMADSIRRQIEIAETFVSDIFGEDVTFSALGIDLDELVDCLDVVEQIIDEAAAQKDQLQRRTARYSPNRAQRRAVRR